MRVIGILFVSVLVLGACQKSASVRSSVAHDYVQLQGAQLVLNQPLQVPAGRARIFLQGGQQGGGFDHYRPHCGFEVRRVDHDGFTVQPDTFRITGVQGSLQQVVMNEPIRLAARVAIGGIDGMGSSAYHDGYHFWLESAQQPEVMRMSCYGVYAVPADLYPPTLEEIGGALGEIAEIRR